MLQRLELVLTVLLGALLAACAVEEAPMEEAPPAWPEIAGYELMVVPADNPMTEAKVALGKQLYYDKRLSGDGERSCYGCHLQEHGLTDGRATALGAFDRQLTRAAPTMWNVGYYDALYWDGRSTALEKQVLGAWGGGNMGASGNDGAPSMVDICAQLNEIPGYAEQFEAVFGGPATPENVGYAVAAFMRTIVTTKENSRFIAFMAGDETALSEQETRGWTIFSEKAKCTNCHDGRLLADKQYHNVGIGMDAENPDTGRARVTEADEDTGAFKTPSLFDISKSAPYFHDGSAATLEEAVDLMLDGGKPNEWLDETNLEHAKNADLSEEERADLLAFLHALDVEYTIEEPTLP
ncbi:MAG: c-type cytochrome [Bryobacterales bacterium]|nr:c-type cytochrome [Bryobacterales bacterium]